MIPLDATDVDGALADTSLLIALEQGRTIAPASPRRLAVSMVSVGELRFGVLAAKTDADRDQRLETLIRAQRLGPIPVDDAVAAAWARLRLDLRAAGRRLPINDSWIAATAIAHDLPVATQDADYDGVPGLRVLRL